MTDRPNPEGPEQDRQDTPPVEVSPDSTPPLPSALAEPAPVPESPPHREAVQAEPHTSVEPVAETATGEYARPAQNAPEFGTGPIPMEPEPSVPDPVSPEPEAPIALALAPETDATLALPPTTKEVEPPPVPSAPPPPPTGVPVPFAAPPTGHSRNFGLKLGLGIGGGALAVIGVVVAIVVAFAVFANSITDKVEGTAEEFVGAVADDDWDTAYAMLCDSYRQNPVEEYVDEWDAWDTDGAEIGPMNPTTGNVTVEFDDGTAVELVIAVDQTAEALDTSVCGWRSTTM